MTQEKTIVLEKQKIEQKIQRMAHELLEKTYLEKEVYILGIKEKGFLLAQKLYTILENKSDQVFHLHAVELNKDNPSTQEIKISKDPIVKDKCVVLVDDVLNSGRTLAFTVAHIMSLNVKTIITLMLVNRTHRRFPIQADIVGISLATTLQDHIQVELKKGQEAVYLV
jgi:pyrimidine operon attenuation protein/uracil phosphoribosyltransferase